MLRHPERHSLARSGRLGVALAAMTFALGLFLGIVIAPDIGRQVRANPAPTPTPAAPPATETPKLIRGTHAAEVLRVIDGDTFEARVHVWPGIDITTRVRLRGIDAPELGGAAAPRKGPRPRPRAKRCEPCSVKAMSPCCASASINTAGGCWRTPPRAPRRMSPLRYSPRVSRALTPADGAKVGAPTRDQGSVISDQNSNS